MKTHPKIWFLRHGQTEWNRAYRLQGQLDSPLTEQGVAEAERQAHLMPEILAEGPEIFVSPLGRACQTADIALRGAPYRTDDRLMEIHAGAWQGRYREELVAENPRLFTAQTAPLDIYAAAEQGEGLEAFYARISDFLNDLKGPSVVVAHGLLGQVLRAELCGVPLQKAGYLSNHQGCVYVLENGREGVLEVDD